MPKRESAAGERRDGQPDPLAALLRSAYPDGSAAPADVEAWAGQVERRHRLRRSRRRRSLTAVCSLAAVVVLAVLAPRLSSPPDGERLPADVAGDDHAERLADVQPDVASLPSGELERPAPMRVDELSRLRAEADSRARVARLVSAGRPRQLEAPPGSAAAADPVDAVRWELNQAALTLVHQADEMARNDALVSVAADWYRRAIERFPETPAASLARQRLGLSPGT